MIVRCMRYVRRVASARVGLLAIALCACVLNVGPNASGTSHTRRSERWGFCAEAEGGGRSEYTPAAAPARGFVAIGHEKIVVPGADPFPCHHSTEHRYSGLVRFDIPRDAHRIVRAVLRPVQSVTIPSRGWTAGSTVGECTVRVARAAEVWGDGFRTTTGTIRTTPLFPGTLRRDTFQLGTITLDDLHAGLDVTSVAREWQDGVSPNLGFVVSSTTRFTRDQRESCLHHVAFEVEAEFEDE